MRDRELYPTTPSTSTSTPDAHEPGRQSLADHEPPQWAGWEELALGHFERSADAGDTEGATARTARSGDADPDGAGEEATEADVVATAASASPIPKTDATTGAHAAPHERNVAHAGVHYAKEDDYNRGSVKDNAFKSKYHVDRPGVRVGKKKGKPKSGRDLFTLQHAEAKRYTFVNENGKNVAREFDTVKKSDLTVVNWKFADDPAPPGKTRLLLNPSTPRKLEIEGRRVPCVFSWVGGASAAWIPVADLKMPGHTRKEITNAVKAQSLRSRPGRAPASLPTVAFVLRPADGIGQADARDQGPVGANGHTDNPLKLGPNHGQGGNEVGHYLGKTIGPNTLYPIAQTLPQADAAVLACDTALAGDHFFVPKDKQFVREVGVYKSGQTKSKRRQTWVYGFLGKQENGKFVADRTRPGWVPLRTLMPAP